MKNKIVLCISGKMRSGKNQFADYVSEVINEKYEVTQRMDMFAGDLKNGAYEDFQRMIKVFKEEYDRLENPGQLDLEWLNVTREQFFEEKTLFTRALLQIYGTDIFCKRIDQDYWAKLVLNKAEKCEEDITLITDTRFPNELSLLQNSNKFKTISIRIDRETGIECDHPSEIALDEFKEWDFIVDNNGDLEQLKSAAETIIDLVMKEDSGEIDAINIFETQNVMCISQDPIFGTKIIYNLN